MNQWSKKKKEKKNPTKTTRNNPNTNTIPRFYLSLCNVKAKFFIGVNLQCQQKLRSKIC